MAAQAELTFMANALRTIRPHRGDGRRATTRAERGAFAIMFAPILMVFVGFLGLALDIGRVYNRKAELQGIAQGIAIAAARELNGTGAGITAALTKAAEEARRKKFGYVLTVAWNDSAIAFGDRPGPDAQWADADTSRGSPTNRFYVKVDTRALNDGVGLVETLFMKAFSDALASVSLGDVAIAGRSTVNVLPLAICAMSPEPASARTNPGPPVTVELVEYGFRRGVGYDLMQLNPDGTSARSFVIDPLASPGAAGSASNTDATAVAPFICAGRMWTAHVTGGPIRVASPFPIGSLYRELNSRMDQYAGSRCAANGSPPDFNIKSYTPGASGGAAWMSPRAGTPAAKKDDQNGRLQTIADLPTPPEGTAPGLYGPLWSYAKAVRFSSYAPGIPEPQEGYAQFATSDWPSLYPATPQIASTTYPARLGPYHATSGSYYAQPSTAHLPISVLERRELLVPLLACPVPAGSNVSATALAIGRFFMTIPATETSLNAEFAGIVASNKLTGQIVLYP